MAAPTPASSRPTPSGISLKDGYSTEVVFAASPSIGFWEKSVQPPGLDAGEPIDITTMHNVRWRTMKTRALITMTPFKMTAAYDPLIFTNALTLLNVQTTVTVFFPDGSTLAFYGFLQKFEPEALEEGKFPMATLTVVPTNMDSTGAEQGPVLTNVAGT